MNDNYSEIPKLKQNNDVYRDNSNQTKYFRNSMIFRVFALLLLLALFMIPISLMEQLIDNQTHQKQNTVDELSHQWGDEQTIIGPILSIPYVERISRIESQTDSNGVKSSVSKDIFSNKTLMLLPENLRINAELNDKVLFKNNAQAHVYQGEIGLTGNFNLEALPEPSAYNSIEWDKAFIAIGFNNNRSVEASSPLRWEGSSTAFKPGTELPTLLKHGYHAILEDVANDNKTPEFKIQLSVKGRQSFKVAPFGDLTSTSIKSDSASIKVRGDIPASSKVSTNDSFEASWRTSNLVRNYPQQWLIEDDKTAVKPDFSNVLIGVEMTSEQQSPDEYQNKIKTVLNYIIPLLALLFLSILILEFKRNSHSRPKFLHYIVIALPVLLMPVLLMTLQSSTNFTQAFQIVAGTSIVLMVFYVMSALKSFGKGFYILLVTASLYAVLYVHLEMPEFVLYAVSIAGLFITVMLMMVSGTIQEDE